MFLPKSNISYTYYNIVARFSNEERSQNADNTSYAPDHDGGCDYVNPRGAM